MSETAPTHASIFTGLYPLEHRLVRNGLSLDRTHQTLAELFSAQGYQTAGIVSSFVLDSKFGWDRGFDVYQDVFGDTQTLDLKVWEGHSVDRGFDRTGSETTRLATRWLWERDHKRPFFLFIHYFDPHSPYDPPEQFEQRVPLPEEGEGFRGHIQWRMAIRNYDGEIAYTDREISRLLDVIDREQLRDDTLVVITADHGEGLYDHGFMLHGLDVYEESVLVPLLFRWPGEIAEGKRVTEPVELVGLNPTILDLVGLRGQTAPGNGKPALDPSRSFEGVLRGGEALTADNAIYLYRRDFPDTTIDGVPVHGDQFGFRVGNWKYIRAEKEERRELYDLERDPGESTNVADANPDVTARLEARLTAFRNRYGNGPDVPSVSEDDRTGLEALGYTVD